MISEVHREIAKNFGDHVMSIEAHRLVMIFVVRHFVMIIEVLLVITVDLIILVMIFVDHLVMIFEALLVMIFEVHLVSSEALLQFVMITAIEDMSHLEGVILI